MAQGADAVAATREDLVWVALMADTSQMILSRGVSNTACRATVKLDHTQPRAQMAAGFRYRRDGFRRATHDANCDQFGESLN